jgi:hypothetical protein
VGGAWRRKPIGDYADDYVRFSTRDFAPRFRANTPPTPPYSPFYTLPLTGEVDRLKGGITQAEQRDRGENDEKQ